jgi:hypothetical protein
MTDTIAYCPVCYTKFYKRSGPHQYCSKQCKARHSHKIKTAADLDAAYAEILAVIKVLLRKTGGTVAIDWSDSELVKSTIEEVANSNQLKEI